MYTINQYGIIKIDGQLVVMEESSELYQDYLLFLENGGSVQEIVEDGPPPLVEADVVVVKPDQTTAATVIEGNQTIQEILAKLVQLQTELDALKQQP